MNEDKFAKFAEAYRQGRMRACATIVRNTELPSDARTDATSAEDALSVILIRKTTKGVNKMKVFRFVADTGPVNVKIVARRLNERERIHASEGTERVYGTISANDDIAALKGIKEAAGLRHLCFRVARSRYYRIRS